MVQREAKASAKKTFLGMSEQKRVEALVSGICNSGPKALALYVMRKDKGYTNSELYGAAETFIDQALPFKSAGKSNLHSYCKFALEPIGLAVEKHVVREQMYGKKFLIAYSITDDGELYGKPAIKRFLLLAHELGVSLNNLNGSTQTSREIRMGYAIARILEVLNNSGESNFATLDKKLSISTCGQLLHLNKLGLVEYESIPIDTYSGVSAKGAATITLLDKVKLEEYIQDDNKLRQDVLSVKPKYREWGYLRRALELKEEKLDYISLSNKLGLREGNHSSKVISTLVKLGIYKYDHFEYRALSKVRITDKGRVAYALAFKPVLEIARNPNSQYEIGLYDVKVEENEIVNLFKEELVRFEATSNYLNTKPMLETTQLTISLLRDTHKDRTFRQTDVIEVLSKAGFVGDLRNKAKQVLRLLRGQNEIESAGKNGFYKLKEPMAV